MGIGAQLGNGIWGNYTQRTRFFACHGLCIHHSNGVSMQGTSPTFQRMKERLTTCQLFSVFATSSCLPPI